MQRWSVNVAPNGRLSLPIELRREMGLVEGGRLDIEVGDGGEVRLLTIAARVRRAQALMREAMGGQKFTVDDFIAEKRKDAALEEEKMSRLAEGRRRD